MPQPAASQLLVGTRAGLAQPADPHLDSEQVLQQSREPGRIRVAVVVGVEKPGLEIHELIVAGFSKAEGWSEQKRNAAYTGRMKNPISSRLGLAHVHDVLKQVCDGAMTVAQACDSLGVCKTRLYELRSDYLEARAEGRADSWRPGLSGGTRLHRVVAVCDVLKLGRSLRRA